ncbi:hypothetical protein ACUN9Y_13315 [Halomonas sp. V046]|uniref:hypothetical protein n=1 Tax=Halomonas sp. V046 TaxID=3459611 RepID=UPI00404431B6
MDEASADRQPARGFMDRIGAQSTTTATNRTQAEANIHDQARPGLLNTALQGALSLTGVPGMVAGKVASTALAANEAQNAIQDHNAEFGLSIDDGYGHSFGRQALGTVTGTLGGMTGSRVGSELGMSVAGPYGGLVGGLMGGVVGGSVGRGMGLNPSPGPGPSDGMGDGLNGPPSAGMMASNAAPSPSQAESVAPTPSYGPVDFDGYASYAEQFFS